MEILVYIFLLITIYLFFKKEKIPEWRKREAEIYFSGSIINRIDEGNTPYTQGLALIKKGNKTKFKKQSKMIL